MQLVFFPHLNERPSVLHLPAKACSRKCPKGRTYLQRLMTMVAQFKDDILSLVTESQRDSHCSTISSALM